MRRLGTAIALLWIAGLAGSALMMGGCAPEPYLSDYAYVPSPGVYEVRRRGADEQAPPVTVLVSVIGIRRPDPDHHVGSSVDFRMRFENNGSEEATFDPASLQLVTGTLQPFPRPYVTPPAPLSLGSGQGQTVTVSVPFPPNAAPGQMDVNELRLRWLVRVNGYPISQTALFERTGLGDGPGVYQPAPSPSFDLVF